MRSLTIVFIIAAVSLAACSTHNSFPSAALPDRCQSAEVSQSIHPALWRTAPTALRAEAAGAGQTGRRFEVERFEQDFATGSDAIERDARTRLITADPRGILAVPEEQLKDQGFVARDGDAYLLFAPTPAVLLAPWFLASHCFGVRSGSEPGVTGLTFQPLAIRTVPDVHGTLWIDVDRAAIRGLEFGYTNLPPGLRGEAPHGVMEFTLLSDGLNILRAWHITSPIIEREDVRDGSSRYTVERTVGLRRTGAEVVRTFPGSDTLLRVSRAKLSGLVYDSIRMAPLAGVRVLLVGTGFSTDTDASGLYTLDELPPGRYRIAFVRPGPDGGTLLLEPMLIELKTGHERIVSIILHPDYVAGRIGRVTAARRPESRRRPAAPGAASHPDNLAADVSA